MMPNGRAESGQSRAHILVVGVEPARFERIEPLLSRICFAVDRTEHGKVGLGLSARLAFDLVIVYHPLPDLTLEDFIAAIRGQDSPSAGSQLLVLTEDPRLEEARRLARLGPSLVLSVNETRTLVEEVASRLLGVAPRVATRLPVRLDVQLQEGLAAVMGQSEDVSGTGMLVRADGSFPLGTKVVFQIQLPDDPTPVQGEAAVVHHTVVGNEKVLGVGLRFLAFKNNGLRRLRVFVARQDSSQ
jgi:DNA-binding NarL/FixJ family response regulator